MNSIPFISKRVLVPGFIILILLILLAAAPSYSSAYFVILMGDVFMYIILTVSWTIFSGPTGYISLATAAFFGIGVYASAVAGNEFPLLVVIGLGGLASFGIALLVGFLTLRLKGIYFAIFTFGLVTLIETFLRWWELNISHTIGRVVVYVDNTTVYYVMFIILVVLMLTAFIIRHSRFGLALQSIGEHEEAAAHIGINVTVVKTIAFAISAFFMGAAGAVMATRWTYIEPSIAFNPLYSFIPVLMAIFGGMGQLYGPVIGATIFTYLKEKLITEIPELYMVIFGVVMVIAILYLPDGLVGIVQKLWTRIRGGKRAHT